KWEGASMMSAIAYPTVSFRKVGTQPKFASPDDSIGFGIIENSQFSIGPAFRYRSGRYDGSDKDLRGIHDVRWTVESGIYADAWINENLRTRMEIRRGFREKDGFVANLGLDLVNSFNSWTVAIGPRLAIADGSFMRHNFGVTARDALLNPRVHTYTAKAGFKSVGMYASATYKFDEQWSATLHGGYERLVGSAARSPVVKSIGSANQMTVGLQLSYSFSVKGF
ncbi:MAG: MipA/OmpV family protein, partial [Proteobacteria bacterium]|nr:MipA/OmpV family protein [Pseudomonadota bacterium]